MKKYTALLLTLLLMLGIAACGTTPAVSGQPAAETPAAPSAAEPAKEVVRTETTITAAELEGKVKLLGRASFTDRGLACDWSASGFSFIVNCEGDISAEVDAGLNVLSRNIHFRLYIDGVESERRFSFTKKGSYPIARGLEPGEHTISFVRDTAVHNYDMFFQSITMTCDASTLHAAPDAELYIDFIGTSLTCGSGCLDVDSTIKANNESATRAFSFLTAQALGADWIFSSRGSMGVTQIVEEDGVQFNLRTLYDSAYGYREPETKYQWTRHPDIEIMDVGPNDKVSPKEFMDATVEFVEHIREVHPDCAIVFVHGFGSSDKYYDYYPQIVERLGGEANLVWECFTPVGAGANDGIHPTVEQHKTDAEVIVKFLQDNVLDKIKK